MSEEIIPTEAELDAAAAAIGSYPERSEREGIFSFLKKILTTPDTSKVSNLDEQELHNVRVYQVASQYAREVNLEEVAKYLDKKGEIILATADSKEGFLIKMAVTQKKELDTKTSLGSGGGRRWKRKE